jgi:hypothetical protein
MLEQQTQTGRTDDPRNCNVQPLFNQEFILKLSDHARMKTIVRKVLRDAENAEMPLRILLASAQSMAWFITSDPRWEASLTSIGRRNPPHQSPNALSSPPKHRFELAVHGELVLRATFQGSEMKIDSYHAGLWETFFDL